MRDDSGHRRAADLPQRDVHKKFSDYEITAPLFKQSPSHSAEMQKFTVIGAAVLAGYGF